MDSKRTVYAIFILLLVFTMQIMIGFRLKVSTHSHVKIDMGYESAEKFESMELNLVLVESAPWLRGTFRMVISILMVVVFWEDLNSLALYFKRHVWDIPMYYLVKILHVIEEKISERIRERRRLFQFMCYLMERNRLGSTSRRVSCLVMNCCSLKWFLDGLATFGCSINFKKISF